MFWKKTQHNHPNEKSFAFTFVCRRVNEFFWNVSDEVEEKMEKKRKREPLPVDHFSTKLSSDTLRSVLQFLDILHCHQVAATSPMTAAVCRTMPDSYYRAQLDMILTLSREGFLRMSSAMAISLLLNEPIRLVPGASSWKQVVIGHASLKRCYCCGVLNTAFQRSGYILDRSSLLAPPGRTVCWGCTTSQLIQCEKPRDSAVIALLISKGVPTLHKPVQLPMLFVFAKVAVTTALSAP